MKEAQKRQMENPHTDSWSSFGGNWTMQEFADNLARRMGSPVSDATGIEGKHHIRIETSSGNPDEPDVTWFDAVTKLGLKLESHKVSAETLAIDEVSKLPTEN